MLPTEGHAALISLTVIPSMPGALFLHNVAAHLASFSVTLEVHGKFSTMSPALSSSLISFSLKYLASSKSLSKYTLLSRSDSNPLAVRVGAGLAANLG